VDRNDLPGRRRQWMALILSGIFPGLGQLYLRAWGKGLAFLLGGLVASWALGRLISIDDLLAGQLSSPAATLASVLALLVLSLWSVVDAWRSGGRPYA
jgi:hypothetical protein